MGSTPARRLSEQAAAAAKGKVLLATNLLESELEDALQAQAELDVQLGREYSAELLRGTNAPTPQKLEGPVVSAIERWKAAKGKVDSLRRQIKELGQ
eukprot:SAG11_NODE_1835_length_4188_cov_2.482514_1_plen_97_part_00